MALLEVTPSAEAREKLPTYLRHFREHPTDAEPVVFGAQRKPEAVILPYERYQKLMETLDDMVIRLELQQRLAEAEEDPGRELAEVMADLGYSPDEFGLKPLPEPTRK